MKNKIALLAIAIIVLAVATITANGRIAPPTAAAQEEGVTHHLSLEENLATEDVARYRAELPPGLQGKLALEYSYEFSSNGEFVVNHRWVATERIDALSYWVRVLDSSGKDISTRLERLDVPESLKGQLPGPQYALYYGAATGPLLPGIVEGSTSGEIREDAAPPARVEISILSYQIEGIEVSIPSPDLGDFIN